MRRSSRLVGRSTQQTVLTEINCENEQVPMDIDVDPETNVISEEIPVDEKTFKMFLLTEEKARVTSSTAAFIEAKEDADLDAARIIPVENHIM